MRRQTRGKTGASMQPRQVWAKVGFGMDADRLHCPRAGGRLRWKDSNVVGAMRGPHRVSSLVVA